MKLLLRWLLFPLFIYSAVRLFQKALNYSACIPLALAYLLCSFALLIFAALVVAPEMASWIATPFCRFIDNIYFPNTSDTPPVDYTLAQLYRKQWKYNIALQEYNKIIHYHPFELNAYIEGIQVAIEANDRKSAQRIFNRGCRKLTQPDDLIYLKSIYNNYKIRKDV